MKLTALFLLLAVPIFPGSAICPQDGESANWDGQRNGKACEYSHGHMDAQTYKVTTHTFWASCGD